MSNLSSLRDMALFVEVARLGNFSKASASLNIPLATLSRRINALEQEFGVRLFNRTTRKVLLTELGLRYFERCEHVVDAAKVAQESLRDAAELPKGHINVTMPVDLGVHIIGPHLPEFHRRYPDISLNIDLSAHHSDLISDKIDIAIRLGKVEGDQLITRRIGAIDMKLYASPSYLNLHGRPTQPSELINHTCLLTGGSGNQATWQLKSGAEVMDVKVAGPLKANNLGLITRLAEQGMGIACIAPILVKDSLRLAHLEPVLPEWAWQQIPISVVMNSRLLPATVVIFLDFIQSKLIGIGDS